MAEHDVANVVVVGSNPITRSFRPTRPYPFLGMAVAPVRQACLDETIVGISPRVSGSLRFLLRLAR